jgi:hypothetical protein
LAIETEVINAGSPNVKAGTEATPLLLILKLPLAVSFLGFPVSADWLKADIAANTNNKKSVILILFYLNKSGFIVFVCKIDIVRVKFNLYVENKIFGGV